MKIRRIAATCAVMALVASMMSVSAFAHGHGGYRRSADVSSQYAYCAVESCTLAGIHEHEGVHYRAHHSGDGHTYHTQNHYYGNHGNRHHC